MVRAVGWPPPSDTPVVAERDMSEHELQSFLASLGSALGAIGETVDEVERRLASIARAYGLPDARFSVFSTALLLTLGQGQAATIEPTTRLSATPRLDQIAAVHALAEEAERGLVVPAEGIKRLEEIRRMGSRFGTVPGILGYATLSVGIALILHPTARGIVVAALLGAFVGVLRRAGRGRRTIEVLMPFIAAFGVAVITALLVKHDVTDPGLDVMIAALVVFVPGVALTTAFLELTEGQMIAGSSRLVWAVTQLGLLAFGIVTGIGAVGISAQRVFASSDAVLGWWAPWVGVLIFAIGVTVAHSAPPAAFPSLLLVLYAAWAGQSVGNELFGGYASGFTGGIVMTLVAYFLARLPSTMPVYAMFLPGFWLLGPGAVGLVGLTTTLATPEAVANEQTLLTVAGSIVAVALGVLCGVELYDWLTAATERARGFGFRRSDT